MAKWTCFTDIDAHFRLPRVLINHSINCFLGYDVLFMICFDEDVADICVLDFALGNLNFGATLVLQSADGFAIFTNDEADSIVGNWNDIC